MYKKKVVEEVSYVMMSSVKNYCNEMIGMIFEKTLKDNMSTVMKQFVMITKNTPIPVLAISYF